MKSPLRSTRGPTPDWPRTLVGAYASAVKSTFLTCAPLLAASFLLTACRSAPTPVAWARTYPDAVTRDARTLDIQVFRHTHTIELSNTTATALGKCTLWLNRRYSWPIEGLAVGEHMEIPLKNFKDEFSDTFRGGGFFASEAPDTLVMVEAETIDEQGASSMRSMIVVKGKPE